MSEQLIATRTTEATKFSN